MAAFQKGKKDTLQGAFSAPTRKSEITPATAVNNANVNSPTIGAHATGDVHPPVGKHNEIGEKKMHRLSKQKRSTSYKLDHGGHHKKNLHIKGEKTDKGYYPEGSQPKTHAPDVKRSKIRRKR